jgi:hypothetical protein
VFGLIKLGFVVCSTFEGLKSELGAYVYFPWVENLLQTLDEPSGSIGNRCGYKCLELRIECIFPVDAATEARHAEVMDWSSGRG